MQFIAGMPGANGNPRAPIPPGRRSRATASWRSRGGGPCVCSSHFKTSRIDTANLSSTGWIEGEENIVTGWEVETRFVDPDGRFMLIARAFDERVLPNESSRSLFRGDNSADPAEARSAVSAALGGAKLGKTHVFQVDDHFADKMMYTLISNLLKEVGIESHAYGDAESALADFPLPVFGSPPAAWEPLKSLLANGSVLGGTAYLGDGNPVLVLVSGGTLFVIWFLKPSLRVARRSLAERVARSLDTKFKKDDED